MLHKLIKNGTMCQVEHIAVEIRNYLRFHGGTWPRVRLLIKCRQLGTQNDSWEEKDKTPRQTSPESILKISSIYKRIFKPNRLGSYKWIHDSITSRYNQRAIHVSDWTTSTNVLLCGVCYKVQVFFNITSESIQQLVRYLLNIL